MTWQHVSTIMSNTQEWNIGMETWLRWILTWITDIQLSAEAAQIQLIWKYNSEQDSAYTNLFGHSQRTVILEKNHVNMNFMVRQGLLYFILVLGYHFHPNSVWPKRNYDHSLTWNQITDSAKCSFPIGLQILAFFHTHAHKIST